MRTTLMCSFPNSHSPSCEQANKLGLLTAQLGYDCQNHGNPHEDSECDYDIFALLTVHDLV